jgi:hypothetical protein
MTTPVHGIGSLRPSANLCTDRGVTGTMPAALLPRAVIAAVTVRKAHAAEQLELEPAAGASLDRLQEEKRMEARIHVLTLAVSDLERALEFYRGGLGLESAGVIGTELVGDDDNAAGAVVMFNLSDGLILARGVHKLGRVPE